MRMAMTPAQVRAKSAAVIGRLNEAGNLATARAILVYVSRGNEIETHGLIRDLLAQGREVAVPAFDADEKTYFASMVLDFENDLEEAKMRILEPRPYKLRRAEMDRFDVFLIPGLAFDRQGHRLGRGMGYFDAMLAGAVGTKIALAYDYQVIDEVPVKPHDVHMDFLVTETRVIACNRK